MSRLRLNLMAGPPGTPLSGKGEIYFDSDRRLKFIDDLGVVNILPANGWMDRNLLINGGFDWAQRQVPGTLTSYAATANRTYGFDRWGMTIQTSNVQCQQIDSSGSPETNLYARYYGKFKQTNSPGKLILTQTVEGVETSALRGRTVRFRFKAKYSIAASMIIRFGLLQLAAAGTIDAPPAAFETAFNVNSADPTWGTNLATVTPVLAEGGTADANGVTATLTNAWVYYSATFVVPITAKNIIPAIWTDSQLASGDELNITEAGLYDGAEIRDWAPMPAALELARCQRFYCKTFPQGTAPADGAGALGAITWMAGKATAVAEGACGIWTFPVTMRATPGTITPYCPRAGGTAGQVTDATLGNAECSATATSNSSDRMVNIGCTGNASTAVGNALQVHMIANAEI